MVMTVEWTAAPDAVRMFRRLHETSTNTMGQNTISHRGKTYFFEPDYVTHPDGAITGEIYRLDGDRNVVETKRFRIEPTGKVSADHVLKRAAKRAMEGES